MQFAVTAEDGLSSEIYSLLILRRPVAQSADVASVSLSIGELQPVFSPTGLDYKLLVSADDESVAVSAITSDPFAELRIGYLQPVNETLSETETCFTAYVTPYDCPEECIVNSTVVVDRSGTFGPLGYTTDPRQSLIIQYYLHFMRQQLCVRKTAIVTRTQFTPMSSSTGIPLSSPNIRLLSQAENSSVSLVYSIDVIRKPSTDARCAAQLTFRSPSTSDLALQFDANATVDGTLGLRFSHTDLSVAVLPQSQYASTLVTLEANNTRLPSSLALS